MMKRSLFLRAVALHYRLRGIERHQGAVGGYIINFHWIGDGSFPAERRWIKPAGVSLLPALAALIRGKASARWADVQEAFDTAIVAIGTNLMGRFRAAFRFFNAVHKNARIRAVKFIAFLVAFPCFKLFQLSFYFSTTALDRKIGRLGGHKLGLNFYDCVGPSSRIGHLFQARDRINHLLECGHPRENLSDHHPLRSEPCAEIMDASGAGVERTKQEGGA